MKQSSFIAVVALALAACTQTPATNTATDTPSMAKRVPMEWVSQQTGTGSDGIPENKLVLRAQGSTEELFSTTCNGTVSTDVQDVPGSVNSAQCWWAGGGDQYGVFIGDAEELTVRHRTVDEESGFGSWEDMSGN